VAHVSGQLGHTRAKIFCNACSSGKWITLLPNALPQRKREKGPTLYHKNSNEILNFSLWYLHDGFVAGDRKVL